MPRKRYLLPDLTPLNKKSKSTITITTSTRNNRNNQSDQDSNEREEIGRLVTQDESGKHALVIQLDRNFIIGRSNRCDFIIDSNTVSSIHCKLYALELDSGEKIVAIEDLSENGILYNGKRLKFPTILIQDDLLEIDQVTFKYFHKAEPGIISSSIAQSQFESKSIQNYLIFDRILGTGANCIVRLALNKNTLKQVACKAMKRSKMTEFTLKAIKREIQILKKLPHPNINQIEEIVHSDQKLYIFLQLVSGGDLFCYLIKNKRLSAGETKWIIFQLLIAIKYLHDAGVVHRDIKLENVILDGAGPFPKVLLADFGEAATTEIPFTSMTGTPIYMSPESLIEKVRILGYDGKSADIWSLGIVLCSLLLGYHPFDYNNDNIIDSASIFGNNLSFIDKDELITCLNMINGNIKLPSIQFGTHDKQARNLIVNLLQLNPILRFSAIKALNHDWFKVTQSELNSLYQFKFNQLSF